MGRWSRGHRAWGKLTGLRVGGGAVGGEHAGPVLTPGPATTYSRAQDSVVLWPLKRLLLILVPGPLGFSH